MDNVADAVAHHPALRGVADADAHRAGGRSGDATGPSPCPTALHVDTRGDYVRNTSWGRFADFDNSANKTVDYYSTAYNAQINALAKGVTTAAGCNTLTTPDATQI